jgi:thiamine biosynthesis protein ThiI
LTILVAYGEIALKGRYVRGRLERSLAEQIVFKIRESGYEDVEVLRRFGRLYVTGVPNEVANKISEVFGVVHVMPSKETDSSFESVLGLLMDLALEIMDEGDTFAIRPRVVGSHSYSSRDLAVEGGNRVLERLKDRGISVDLEEPDETFHIEVRDERAFIYTEIIDGFGGLPYGTQGKMASLFSGGIDSPVSSWLLMKRGVDVLPLFVDQRPYVGESYVDRAEKAFKTVRKYAPVKDFNLYKAPFGDVMSVIQSSPESRYFCILCKRSMYRVAEFFCLSRGLKGIVTGESLGQVASQTLDNMFVLDEAVDIPVYRPLIGMDKVEIEHLGQRIGTYGVTAKTVDGCQLVPENPATRSNIAKLKELEKNLDLYNVCKRVAEEISQCDIN